ncbi:hypothetical protein EC991_006564 [Linnemannia zychae]|nr:hypothetical protein EC991_006564 [Linnemannia zychae]
MATTRRFFDIQDLVDTLSLLLTIQDISRLTRTNRGMKAQWLPLFYRNLNMTYYSRGKRLLRSADAKLALSRNVRHVRILKLGLCEMAYLYNSMLAYVDLAFPNAGPDTRPTWLPASDRSTFHVVPLPPMAQLTQLEVYFDRSKDNTNCPYIMSSTNNTRANLAQACWIVLQSTSLVDITLKSIAIKDDRDLRLLMMTLNGLTQLKTLRLSVLAKPTKWCSWGSAVFLSCSTSVHWLQINMQDIAADHQVAYADRVVGQENMDRLNNGAFNDTCGFMSPSLRTERLVNMKELALWEMDKSTTAQDLIGLFTQCPNIETLTVSNISGSYDTEMVTQIVSEFWPPHTTDQL